MCLKDKLPEQGEVEERPATIATNDAVVAPVSPSTAEKDSIAMTPDILPTIEDLDTGCLVFVVRDMMSGAVGGIPRETFVLSTSATVGMLFSEVSRKLHYPPDSFILTLEMIDYEIDLNDLSEDLLLGMMGLLVGSSKSNLVVLTKADSRRTGSARFARAASPKTNMNIKALTQPKEDDYEKNPTYDKYFSQEPKTKVATAACGAAAVPAPSTPAASAESPPAPVIMPSVKASYVPPSSLSRIKSETAGYVGLVNQAMTCYLNSLLQTLFMTPEFRNALYRWEFKGSTEEASKSIPYQLQKLFLQLQIATRSAVETTNLTKSFGWDSSEVWQQHDIQELYRVMFDALEQCFKNTDQAELINDLYEGKMKDYVKCLECSTENAREDSFLDIPLPIRPFGSTTVYKCVEEALRAFVEPELLTGNNKYECAKCSSHCDAHKGLKFTRFPYLLTLHLKRFDFDYQTFHRIKLNDKVTFPIILDLNGFIENKENSPGEKEEQDKTPEQQTSKSSRENSPTKCSTGKLDDAPAPECGSAPDVDENNSVGVASSNQLPNDTDMQDEAEGNNVSCLYNEKNRSCMSNGPYVYELFSIMIHSGSASGGHYYAYIKDFKTGEWFCFNDQSVSRITYEDIQKTFGGANARGYYSSWSSSANAYMLMYRKADKERNVNIFSQEDFPPHIKDLVQKMMMDEAAEREALEDDSYMDKLLFSSQVLRVQMQRDGLDNDELFKGSASPAGACVKTTKINVFCQHPKIKLMAEAILKVHLNQTFEEIIQSAYKKLLLESLVPIERCRLVKYNSELGTIGCSFENSDILQSVLPNNTASSEFELLMEIRDEDKEFEVYKPEDVIVNVMVVNLATEEVEGPDDIRVPHSLTCRKFKEQLGEHYSMDPDKMRVVLLQFSKDCKPIVSDTNTLRKEGFFCKNKVYIEASGEESPTFFHGSKMYRILDRCEHTVKLNFSLPILTPEVLKELRIPPYNPEDIEESDDSPKPSPDGEVQAEDSFPTDGKKVERDVDMTRPQSSTPPTATMTVVTASATDSTVTSSVASAGASRVTLFPSAPATPSEEVPKKKVKRPSKGKGVPLTPTPSPQTPTAPTSSSSETSAAMSLSDEDECIGSSSTVNSDQSASEDSSLTSDSDRTLVGEPPEIEMSDNSPDYHNVSSPEDNPKDSEKNDEGDWGPSTDCSSDRAWADLDEDEDEASNEKRYFKAHLIPRLNVLRVKMDERITFSQLKTELQKYVGVSEEHFKIYKKYTMSSHEFECTKILEILTLTSGTFLTIRFGRALMPGEIKGKVFLLLPFNSEDPSKFLIDFVICKKDSVLKVKNEIVQMVNSKYSMNLDPTRVRLRKKLWKNPHTIYLDHQIFDHDIFLRANWELYLQEIEGPEVKTDDDEEVSIFLKRWRPSTYATDPLKEIILTPPTADALKKKISLLSAIPVENVDLAKGSGSFPCDMSVLDIPTQLDWSPKTGLLRNKPLYVLDDSAVVIYYKDRTETLKTLSEAERNVVASEENYRLHRDSPSSFPPVVTRTREKGLKIYLNHPSS